jgi:hypothetical protein
VLTLDLLLLVHCCWCIAAGALRLVLLLLLLLLLLLQWRLCMTGTCCRRRCNAAQWAARC